MTRRVTTSNETISLKHGSLTEFVNGLEAEITQLKIENERLKRRLDRIRVEAKFEEGDVVHKPKGYRYPGIVVCVFKTLHGKVRYVVEATGEGYEEMLHIFNGDQLALTRPDPGDQ